MIDAASRIDRDTMGEASVPAAALYGPHTARALGNFPISGRTLSEWPSFIASLARVKQACAYANHALGRLPDHKYQAIDQACREICTGEHDDQFVVDLFQGGAGTSTNMNVNEVVANLAARRQGHWPGSYGVVHPIDDVNMSQSTNDVYPSATRLTVLLGAGALVAALESLTAAFARKAAQFSTIEKLGRTQLQDAVPMTLGQEFAAFAATLAEDLKRMPDIHASFAEINLGGTAIGTGLNAPPGFGALATRRLGEISGIELVQSENLVEAAWDMGAFVLYSGMLKRTATKLSKIANDLRLLASGPVGGLGEITLPRRQPGSSIMPSKVNPVIPEVLNQVCFHVIGNDITITLAAEAGQLQLNAMMPVIVLKILESQRYLTNAIRVFAELCVKDIEANAGACARPLTSPVARATALVPVLGYEAAARIAALIDQGMSFDDAVRQREAQ
ncbi:MAG: aspartate ammonia-lyase [Parvibaculaceae bacterium]